MSARTPRAWLRLPGATPRALAAALLALAFASATLAASLPSTPADAAPLARPRLAPAALAAAAQPAVPAPRAPSTRRLAAAPAAAPAPDVRALRREARRLHVRAARLSRAIRLTSVAPLRLTWSARQLAAERRRWARRLAALERLAATPARERLPRWDAWMCIHRHEGAWDAPGGTYYGGLQMDLEFQRTYGPDLLARKGTADRWTPLEQVLVAERAYAVRGFSPWPNTARMCGVL